MGFADYKPVSEEIQLGGGQTASVRGISFLDLSVLVREHMPDLDAVFDLFQEVDRLTPEGMKTLAVSLASQMPGLAANIIALASDEENALEGTAKLPFPLQVECLVKIGELTFTEVGGVKKFLETVAALLQTTKIKKLPKTVKAG